MPMVTAPDDGLRQHEDPYVGERREVRRLLDELRGGGQSPGGRRTSAPRSAGFANQLDRWLPAKDLTYC